MPTANKHWASDLWKNKFVKIPVIISFWALMGLILLIVIKATFGYHVNIFGLELNKPTPKTDTITIVKNVEAPKTNDSPIITPNDKKNSTNLPILIRTNTVPKAKGDTGTKVQSTVTGDNNKTVVGNNSGIVGDVTVNNGMPQRRLTREYANMVYKRLMDTLRVNSLSKTIRIRFGSTMGSDESFQFSNEVANFLNANGFTNISDTIGPTVGNNELRILYIKNQNEIFIDVGMRRPGNN